MVLIHIPMYTCIDYGDYTFKANEDFIKKLCDFRQRHECEAAKNCLRNIAAIETCYQYYVRVSCERYEYEGRIHNPHKIK